MINKKISINQKLLRAFIANKTSIRKLGPDIGYSEKTIRRGLEDEKMSMELILLISKKLSIKPSDFSDIKDYLELLNQLETD